MGNIDASQSILLSLFADIACMQSKLYLFDICTIQTVNNDAIQSRSRQIDAISVGTADKKR